MLPRRFLTATRWHLQLRNAALLQRRRSVASEFRSRSDILDFFLGLRC